MYVRVYIYIYMLIPEAARSKARFCDRSLAGIAVSNPAGVMGFFSLVSVVCCVRKGLCVGPITHPEESYRQQCV